MADKHTKKELFQTLLVLATATECEDWITAGIQNELNLLAKRASAKGGNIKKAAEQRVVKDTIALVLEGSDEPMKATAIGNEAGISVQKASALLRQMVADGEVVRTEDKKEVFFSLAE